MSPNFQSLSKLKLKWGGISSEEHDEAVLLEAAMFGGIPEGSGYRYAYAPHEFMQSRGLYPTPTPRPPSPSLAAQRLLREQQVQLISFIEGIVSCRRWLNYSYFFLCLFNAG